MELLIQAGDVPREMWFSPMGDRIGGEIEESKFPVIF